MSKFKYGTSAVAMVLGTALFTSACTSSTVSGPVDSKQVENCTSLSMGLVAMELPTGKGGPSGSGGSKGSSPKTGGSKSGGSKGTKPSGGKSKAPKKSKSGSGKSCSTEYELMIQDKEDGLVEEDVTAEEYARCDVGEKFPACREGK